MAETLSTSCSSNSSHAVQWTGEVSKAWQLMFTGEIYVRGASLIHSCPPSNIIQTMRPTNQSIHSTTPSRPLQMVTPVQETGGCVSLSELVIGVTTTRCCRQTSDRRMCSIAGWAWGGMTRVCNVCGIESGWWQEQSSRESCAEVDKRGLEVWTGLRWVRCAYMTNWRSCDDVMCNAHTNGNVMLRDNEILSEYATN